MQRQAYRAASTRDQTDRVGRVATTVSHIQMVYNLLQVGRHSLQLSINVFSQLVPASATRRRAVLLDNVYSTETV